MRAIRALVLIALAGASLVTVQAGQGAVLIVHHNANLRASASTQSAIKAHLVPGDELTKVAAAKQNGFHHVRTSTGVEGWVYQTLVHEEEEDDTVPTAPAVPGAAAAFDPNWAKPSPIGSILQGPGGQTCPADGEAGADIETNRLKNRKDVPSSYHQVTFDALANLQYPIASTSRKSWTQAQKDAIAPFEGAAISVVGFIVAVKKQHGGGGETTNCHFNTVDTVDVHVALVKNAGEGEEKSIVVEPTPRFYAQHPKWIWTQLKALDDSPDPIRISGWLLMDPVHKNHLNKYRSTLWEIHPVTKIEVFKNGQWTVW